jgi:hypothetical protein
MVFSPGKVGYVVNQDERICARSLAGLVMRLLILCQFDGSVNHAGSAVASTSAASLLRPLRAVDQTKTAQVIAPTLKGPKIPNPEHGCNVEPAILNECNRLP